MKLLNKFAPNYSISNLCNKWLLTPIKRWKRYINNKTKLFINPFILWWLYMWEDTYVFWWLRIYNQYWFSEQIAERYTIYNTKFSWQKIIWNTKFIFIRQRESFFYWIQQQQSDNFFYKIMSKERAIIQMIKDNNITQIPDWVDKSKLQKIAKKYASTTLFNKIQKICI